MNFTHSLTWLSFVWLCFWLFYSFYINHNHLLAKTVFLFFLSVFLAFIKILMCTKKKNQTICVSASYQCVHKLYVYVYLWPASSTTFIINAHQRLIHSTKNHHIFIDFENYHHYYFRTKCVGSSPKSKTKKNKSITRTTTTNWHNWFGFALLGLAWLGFIHHNFSKIVV